MSLQIPFWYGVGEKDRILAAMRENHPIYLTTLRSFAREIALRSGRVCIDDIREMIAQRDFPMPKDIGITERVFGVVFLAREFEPVGQVVSRREDFVKRVGRARSLITVYRLRGQVAA